MTENSDAPARPRAEDYAANRRIYALEVRLRKFQRVAELIRRDRRDNELLSKGIDELLIVDDESTMVLDQRPWCDCGHSREMHQSGETHWACRYLGCPCPRASYAPKPMTTRRYRVPKGTGDRPATERDGALPRLRRTALPSPLAHPWLDYDVVEIEEPDEAASSGGTDVLAEQETPPHPAR